MLLAWWWDLACGPEHKRSWGSRLRVAHQLLEERSADGGACEPLAVRELEATERVTHLPSLHITKSQHEPAV